MVKGIEAGVDAGYWTVAEACAEFGVDRSTYYRWRERVARYEAGDARALDARSSRPRRHGRRKRNDLREEVVRLAKTGEFGSPTAIARYLREQGTSMHPGTAIRILEVEGLYGYVTKVDRAGNRRKVRGLL